MGDQVTAAGGSGGQGFDADSSVQPEGSGGTEATVTDAEAMDGPATSSGDTGAADAPPVTGAPHCSDLFDQETLAQYWVDISADELSKMTAEFMDISDVLAGTPKETYHPIVLHYGSETGETMTDAAMRLKGQSSWVMTVQNDPLPKMQVVISFNQTNPNGKFHGVTKLGFDMPRSDWTLLHERLANTWWRQRSVMAPCSNSGQLFINSTYYGLYVVEDHVGHALVKQYFPGNSDGNLFKGGVEPEQNNTTINVSRLLMFQGAKDIQSMTGLIDLDGSVLEWAGDAVLNNGDGYYGGSHNFYVYDQGQKGYVWLPADTDSTFDWLTFNSTFTSNLHPIYWWVGRPGSDPPGQYYLAVINDPIWRQHYVDDIATQLAHWDVSQMQSWIDTWSHQIAQAVMDDPRKQATVAQWEAAVAQAHDVVAQRAVYLQSFVACERGEVADDKDGDGVAWCNDCADDDPSVHPGALEICGNNIDDNCNGVVDENCPGEQPGYPGQMAAGGSAGAGSTAGNAGAAAGVGGTGGQ